MKKNNRKNTACAVYLVSCVCLCLTFFLCKFTTINRNASELIYRRITDDSGNLNYGMGILRYPISPSETDQIYKNCANEATRKLLYVLDNFCIEAEGIPSLILPPDLCPEDYRDYVWRTNLYYFHKYHDLGEKNWIIYDENCLPYGWCEGYSYYILTEEEVQNAWNEYIKELRNRGMQAWIDAGYKYMTREELNNWQIDNPLPTEEELRGHNSFPLNSFPACVVNYESYINFDLISDDYLCVRALLVCNHIFDTTVKPFAYSAEEQCDLMNAYYSFDGDYNKRTTPEEDDYFRKIYAGYQYYFDAEKKDFVNSGYKYLVTLEENVILTKEKLKDYSLQASSVPIDKPVPTNKPEPTKKPVDDKISTPTDAVPTAISQEPIAALTDVPALPEDNEITATPVPTPTEAAGATDVVTAEQEAVVQPTESETPSPTITQTETTPSEVPTIEPTKADMIAEEENTTVVPLKHKTNYLPIVAIICLVAVIAFIGIKAARRNKDV